MNASQKNLTVVLLIGVLALLGIAGYHFYQNLVPFEKQKPTIGEAAPEFTLAGLNGGMVRLSDFRGKVVLLNFGASWCPPCREEMPGFQKAFQTYRDKGFSVIVVAMNDPKPSSLVEEFHAGFPVVLPNEQLSMDYGNVAHIPISFLIGRDGRIVKKVIGVYSEEELQQDVKKLLEVQRRKDEEDSLPSRGK